MTERAAVLSTVGRVGARASLNDVVLWELHTSQASASESPRRILVQTDVDQSVARHDGGFQVMVDYTVRGLLAGEDLDDDPADGEAGSEAMAIAASWLLVYGLSEDVELADDDLTAYSEITARFTVHPYMREMVQQMTVRMGFPPLLLEHLKFPLDDLLAQDTTAVERGE